MPRRQPGRDVAPVPAVGDEHIAVQGATTEAMPERLRERVAGLLAA